MMTLYATKKLREVREEKKLTQSEMTQILQTEGQKITRATYSKIEMGRVGVKVTRALIIARVFKVNFPDIFNPQPPKENDKN